MQDLPLFDPFAKLAEIRKGTPQSPPQKRPRELSQELSQPPAREKGDIDQSVSSSLATLATLAGPEHAPSLAPAPVLKKRETNSSFISMACDTSRTLAAEHDGSRAQPPARVARVARVAVSDCSQSKISETAVARVFEGPLREWHQGLQSLTPDRVPCPGYRSEEWARVLRNALAFLDAFGPQAVALGWTTPRLFGVHPEAGAVRVDACGALMIGVGGEVRAITATEIRFGHLTHRMKPGQPEGVPVWEFGR